MKYNPRIHHRRSNRLKGYDYGQPGFYFVTLCCFNKLNLFGEIQNGVMILNTYGEIAQTEWNRTPQIRPNIALGPFVVMPDHLHGIIIIKERSLKNFSEVGAYCNTPLPQKNSSNMENAKLRSPSQTLGAILRGYRGAVTKQINILRGTPGQKVWQRNFDDRIIRSEKSYRKIISYLLFNPKKWQDSIDKTSR